jgi:hypothetical protein
MKDLVIGCLFALSFDPLLVYAQNPLRALPDDNLAYPVLIATKSSSGSGFYLNTESGVYLVTAKHVLFDSSTGNLQDTSFNLLSYSKDLSDLTPTLLTIDTAKTGKENIIGHPSQDVAVIRLFSANPHELARITPLSGVTVRSYAKSGLVGVALKNIKRFADVLVGNDAILLGFPTSLGLQTMPQIDARHPLLRKGIVAGENLLTHSIILDCPVYFGNSGSPVIEIDHDALGGRGVWTIGVVSQYVPYADGGKTFTIMANSGYSVVVPMDYVLELIK